MGEGQGEGATPQSDPLPLAPSHKGREEKTRPYLLGLHPMAFYLEKDFFEDVELFNLVGKVMSGDLTLHWYEAKTEQVRVSPKNPVRGLTLSLSLKG